MDDLTDFLNLEWVIYVHNLLCKVIVVDTIFFGGYDGHLLIVVHLEELRLLIQRIVKYEHIS